MVTKRANNLWKVAESSGGAFIYLSLVGALLLSLLGLALACGLDLLTVGWGSWRWLAVISLALLFQVPLFCILWLEMLLSGLLRAKRGFEVFALGFFYPLALIIRPLFGVDKVRFLESFVAVNNLLVNRRLKPISPQRLLVLLPHCIQDRSCPHRITFNINNCTGCGKCEVKELREVSEKWGFQLYVVPGGSLARRMVLEHLPDAIVAVACERDLVSGIIDSFPIPVYAIINLRPQGYCLETCVDVGLIRRTIEVLMGGRLRGMEKGA
jgi:hypothetical protein